MTTPRRPKLDAIGRSAKAAWVKANALPRCPEGRVRCQFVDIDGACGALATTRLRPRSIEGLHAGRPCVCDPHKEHLLSPAVQEERDWEILDYAGKEGFAIA